MLFPFVQEEGCYWALTEYDIAIDPVIEMVRIFRTERGVMSLMHFGNHPAIPLDEATHILTLDGPIHPPYFYRKGHEHG